jgi:alanyl-tRNA synthetase
VATLERGQKQLDELLAAAAAPGSTLVIGGGDAFMLYDTFGFPLELTQELAEARGVSVDVAGFEEEMEAQRQRSKDSRWTWGVGLPEAGRVGTAGARQRGWQRRPL